MNGKGNSTDWRAGSKRRMIAELAERGNTKRETFAELRPLVESQVVVFRANVGGHRTPKPMAEQLIELKNEIGRVYALLGRATSSDFDSADIPADTPVPDTTPEEITPEETTPEVKPPRAKAKTRTEDSLREFLRRVRTIRAYCDDRRRRSEAIDSISMRPAQAAAKLIPAGIPVNALIAAMTMHWPLDVRREAGIAEFDFLALSREIMKSRGIESITRADGTEETPHGMFGYALVLAECRVPIFLVGPAGTGKSHLLTQIADFLGVRYGETPMSPGATRGDLLGRHTIGGFIAAQCAECYVGGGLFNFEEMDASDASMLIVLNNALASKRLYNSTSGEMLDKHADFIPAACGNTFGLGANREYTARERLDAATLDRWRMGRIFLELDETIEERILGL